MAEIRKHDPSKGNAIVEALRQAMGDPIRPVTPGQPASAKRDEPEPKQTSWVSLSFAPEDAKPAADATDDLDEDVED